MSRVSMSLQDRLKTSVISVTSVIRGTSVTKCHRKVNVINGHDACDAYDTYMGMRHAKCHNKCHTPHLVAS